MGSLILEAGQLLYSAYYWLILIYIFSSWVPKFQATKIGTWIGNIVDPYLSIFRRFVPPFGPIDFSPIIALFVYRYIGKFALEGLRQVINVTGL